MPASRQLPPAVAQALADYKERLSRTLPGRVREIRVFGSVARGEADEYSDVDVLVVLDHIDNHAERVLPMELGPEAGLPRGLVIQALVLSEDELDLQRRRETGLAEALDRDGISI